MPRLEPPKVQVVLAASYLREQQRRIIDEAEPAGGNEKLSAALAAHNDVLEGKVEATAAFIAERALEITGADGAAVALATAEGHVECLGRAGELAPEVGTRISPDSRLSFECLRTGCVTSSSDITTDHRVPYATAHGSGIRSMVAVPVRRQDEIIGLLEVFSVARCAFSMTDTQAVELLAAALSGYEFERPEKTAPDPVVAAPPIATDPVPVSAPEMEPEPLVQAETPEPATLATLASYRQSSPSNFRIALRIVLLLSVAVALFWPYRKSVSHRTSTEVPSGTELPAPSAPVVQTPGPAPELALGHADLIGVDFRSHAGFASVKLNLTGPVRYHAGRLTNPNRIFIDLEDTQMTLRPTHGAEAMFDVGDQYVSRIRVAQKESDVTRIVLDLNASCDFMPVLSRTPPFALVLTVQPSVAEHDSGNSAVQPGATRREVKPTPPPSPTPRVLGQPLRIVIDPGHGGADTGTVGPTGLQEKDLVLAISQRLGQLIVEKLGGEVVFTRSDDTFIPLQARATLANAANADLLISVHCNSSTYRSVRGIETFVSASASSKNIGDGADPRTVESRRLAGAVQHAMYSRLKESDPGLHDRGVKSAPLVVLAESAMPSILIELSFVSSPVEELKLMDPAYRDAIAAALCDGISRYFTSKKTAPLAARVHSAVQRSSN
ncbi:MAG: N-acetylmuramoyl-L-alanine amidase [Terriglobales bacterium]